MAQIQFYLIGKKKNIRRPEHLLTHPFPVSDNISFLPYAPLPLKLDVICVSPLIGRDDSFSYFRFYQGFFSS